ncbi:MAG: peptidoglycan-binding protein [Synechococcales cyanobacterium RU_4_20]|nr:peptidoglycan-binding protein [Synechococcales cyanobacterium RU_4_20]
MQRSGIPSSMRHRLGDWASSSGLAGVWAMAALGAAGALCLGELVAAGGLAQAALGRADRCEPVLQMQQELSRRTYSVGPLDGIFGPQTEFAVRRFQANQGLPVTGQVEGATAIALGLPQGVSCNPVAQASHRVATPGTSLNRRDRPSGTVLDQLADRTPVVVVETQMGWSRLQQGGWVASNFLVPLGSGSLGQNSTAQSSAGGGGGSNGGGNTLFIPPSQAESRRIVVAVAVAAADNRLPPARRWAMLEAAQAAPTRPWSRLAPVYRCATLQLVLWSPVWMRERRFA